MEIQISNKNEFKYVPDIGNNKDLPDQQQFKIVYKMLSNRLHSAKWTSFNEDGEFNYNLFKKASEFIVRLENPPILNFGSEKRPLKVEDLATDKWHELYPIVEDFINEIEKKKDQSASDKKK